MNLFISTLAFAANAVLPILGLILLGYYARQTNLLTAEFIRPANRFTFRFGISTLMYVNLYSLKSFRDIPLRLACMSLLFMSALTALGFLAAKLFTKVKSRKGVLIQAAFRSNYAIIGIPLAAALAGNEGSMVASSVQAPSIIFYNFMSVLALSLYSETEGSFKPKKVAKSIATNPLIFALILGLVTLAVRSLIPTNADGSLVFSIKENLPAFYKILTYLANMATPLALVILGAQFNFTAIRDRKKELLTGVILRIILSPLIGFTLAFTAARFGIITIDPATMACLIALFGSPMAVSSVVMTGEMGGDDVLAGQIVVWTSLISMFTIFVTVVFFRMIGMI